MAAPTFTCEVAFAANPGLSYLAAVLADSPTGYWRLDDLTTETGTAGVLTEGAGTPPSAASLLTTDTASVARTLNGSSHYYTAADGAGTDLGDVFTLEMWVKPTNTSAQRRLFDKGTNAYALVHDNGGAIALQRSGVAVIVTSTVTMTAGQIYHVVATKNGATVKLYINGVDRTGAVTNATCTNTSTALHIGRQASSAAQFFNGDIDEVAIYPTALTQARVQAHFEAGNPTWTTIPASLVLGFTTKRGRQKELDRVDAGTATVRFNNSDRRFDPTHTSSPYFPNVLPMRQIRLRAVHNSVTYDKFRGFVQAWPQAWQGPNVGTVDVSCTDAFLPLSFADVGENETWPRELAGARINRVLDLAGWPSADRLIDTGQSEVAEVTFALGSGVTALDHIREVAGADLGMFFCDGSGRAVFHDRHHRKAAAYLTSAGTFGDANTGGIPYQSVELDTDPARIWNDIQVTATGGVTQRSQDLDSQEQFFRRTMARQVPLANDTDAASQAAHLARRYSQPTNRLSGIRITPQDDTARVAVLARELADHVTVERHPQEVGSVISQECSLEAIEYSVDPHAAGYALTATWLVSTPAYTAIDWWILGDATYSDLGVTTKVAY